MDDIRPLSDQIQSRLERLGDERRRRIADRLRAVSEQLGMWMTDEETDETRTVPMTVQPTLVDPATEGYLHHAAWQMRLALQRLPDVIAEDPAAAGLLEMSEAEHDWFNAYKSPMLGPDSRFCRVDALFRNTQGSRPAHLKFIEPNVVGLGGMCYAVDTVQLLAEHILPELVDQPVSLTAQPGDDPRELLFRELLDFSRARGAGQEPTVAIVGSRSGYETDGEDARLIDWLGGRGLDALFADPGELELADDGAIVADGRRISFIFRTMELSDLVEREEKEGRLDALRTAFERDLVAPSVGGDLEHKCVFELFTSEQFAHHFTPGQRRVFDQHVLWTRLVADRRTNAPHGPTVHLPNYIRSHRRDLVLKPNRSYGGSGVLIGKHTDPEEWRQALAKGLSDESDLVVQQLAGLVRDRLPVPHQGTLENRSVYTVIGIFPSRHGVGLLGRYSDDSVVNVSLDGGVVPFMIDFS